MRGGQQAEAKYRGSGHHREVVQGADINIQVAAAAGATCVPLQREVDGSGQGRITGLQPGLQPSLAAARD